MFIFRIISAIAYYFNANTIYNLHSPFIYNFIRNVFDTHKEYYAFSEIEKCRKFYIKKNETEIPNIDFGASKNKIISHRKLSDIAHTMTSSPWQCKIIHNIILHNTSSISVELGTSLGIATLYMACSRRNAQVYTLEGNPYLANIAEENAKQLGCANVQVVSGPFAKTLPQLLQQLTHIDFLFIDGHHTYEATIAYYTACMPKLTSRSVVMVDDIRWNKEMWSCWSYLITRPEVTLSIDSFDFGLLFFDTSLTKQNITYIPFSYKPWSIGIFG